MMAGIMENPLINKMMINWAERLEDRQATEDVLDAMTQQEPREAFVESEDEQEQRDNLELLRGDYVARGRLGRSQLETAETKGELSREDAHGILRSTMRIARSCRLTAERRSDAHPCGQRPQGNASGIASVGDL